MKKETQNWKSYFSGLFFGTEIAKKLQPSKYFCVFAQGLLVITVPLPAEVLKKWKITDPRTVRCCGGVQHVSVLPFPLFTPINELPSLGLCWKRPLKCWVQLWGCGPVLETERASIYLLTGDPGDTEPHYLPFETSPLWWLADHTTLRAL